jgi:hypothetical protein
MTDRIMILSEQNIYLLNVKLVIVIADTKYVLRGS